jgi:hypothetical protein
MADEARRWVVDSLEEGVATVVEDDARVRHVPAWLLPDTVREGDVLRVARRNEGVAALLRIEVDGAATEAGRARSLEQLGRLVRSDSEGDIVI